MDYFKRMMLMNCCSAILVSLMTGAVLARKRCGDDQFLTAKGKCRNCRFCPPGKGMDFNSTVPTNTNGEPTACRPCAKCPDGYYNIPDSGQYACSKCRLNCAVLNRKEYETCGRTSPGKCGACINSLYEDRENNLDSPCYLKTGANRTVDALRISRLSEQETKEQVLPNGASYTKDQLHQPTNGSGASFTRNLLLGIIVTVVVVGGVILALVIVIYKRRRISETPVAPSSVYLLESSSSEGVEPHGSFSSARLSVYDETSDIETDGLNHGCQRNPYGEVQRYTSSGPSGLHKPPETGCKSNSDAPVTYPDIIVREGDKYLKYLAKELCGDDLAELFRELGVRNQKIYESLHLFNEQKITLEDAVYKLLLHWVQLKVKKATLSIICPILDKIDLNHISQELLNMANSSDNATSHRPFPDSCSMHEIDENHKEG